MISFEYQGFYILFVYFFVSFAIGLQFGFLSFFIRRFFTEQGKRPLLFFLATASLWVFLELMRLFIVCGFSWNPVGISLAFHPIGMQAAALWGVYGLSFWVIFTNLWGLKALFHRERRTCIFWGICLVFPYLFGFFHIAFHEQKAKKEKAFSALLIQTALRPEEKSPHFSWESFVSPYEQWRRIFKEVGKQEQKADLVVLPEVALPFGASRAVYPLEEIEVLWREVFPFEMKTAFPENLFAYTEEREGKIFVSNVFILQVLANAFQQQWVAGLETYDPSLKKGFNAAFYFRPGQASYARYEKRVLVPIGEYIPYNWLKSWAKIFGIHTSFSVGKEAKVFSEKNPFSISICYEETFPYLIREGRKKGAKLFINLSNDVWFPKTTLALQHYLHGMLRAIENGASCLRATNTGITAAVDPLGREVASFLKENSQREETFGGLFVSFPLYSFSTLYTLWGELPLLLGGVFFLGQFVFRLRNRACSKKGNWLTFSRDLKEGNGLF